MAPKFRVLAAAIATAFCALPGAAGAMDLTEAYRAALAIDPAVRSARAQLEATRERVPQARAGLLPGVNLSAGVNRASTDLSNAPTRNYTSQNYLLGLTMPLVRMQNWETYEQSKLTAAIGDLQFELVQQDLIVRVSQAYFDVLASQDNLATIQAQKVAISEQLASAKRNFEVGTATITDQQEAQSRYDLVTAQQIAIENDLAVKRAALAQLIGRPVPELKTLRSDISISPPQPSRESEWTEAARTGALAVQQAQLSTEVARREIQKQRYGHLPTLDAIGQASRNQNAAVNFLGVTSHTGLIGLQLNWPIYQGGATEARVREALALRDKSESDLDGARRVAEQSARQFYLGFANGLATVQALEAAERSSKLALDSNMLGYQVGVRINIDVLNSQQQLFTTQRDLAKARYDTLLNGLRLRYAAGSLSEDDLQRITPLLDYPKPGAQSMGMPDGAKPGTPAPAAAPISRPADVTPPKPATVAPQGVTPRAPALAPPGAAPVKR
jgi:outer membrane protein